MDLYCCESLTATVLIDSLNAESLIDSDDANICIR